MNDPYHGSGTMVEIEIPEKPEYDDGRDDDMDSALLDAYNTARLTDHAYLEHLLACELASLRFDENLGIKGQEHEAHTTFRKEDEGE